MAGKARRIVVVGASLGALRATEQLRKRGWDGEIVVIGDEPHMPYNRPPLSKAVLADADLDDHDAAMESVVLRVREEVDAQWRLGCPATAVDLDARAVQVSSLDWIEYDGLVVATGIRPRRLPFPDGEHRLVVRDFNDALATRWALKSARHVVLVGGGFIGCEIAGSARQLGCHVTVVEAAAEPMAAALGVEVAGALRRRHERKGIDFRTGVGVTDVESASGKHRISLDDGEELRPDVVIEAIGSAPNVEWLEGNGLDLSDGVLCDEHLRVGGRPEVVAVGDVARFPLPRFRSDSHRVEHWSVPGDTAKVAAATLVAGLSGHAAESVVDLIPSFWSDQLGVRLQAFGVPTEAQIVQCLDGDLDGLAEADEPAIAGYYRDDRLVGVLGVGVPGPAVAQYRSELGAARHASS